MIVFIFKGRLHVQHSGGKHGRAANEIARCRLDTDTLRCPLEGNGLGLDRRFAVTGELIAHLREQIFARDSVGVARKIPAAWNQGRTAAASIQHHAAFSKSGQIESGSQTSRTAADDDAVVHSKPRSPLTARREWRLLVARPIARLWFVALDGAAHASGLLRNPLACPRE